MKKSIRRQLLLWLLVPLLSMAVLSSLVAHFLGVLLARDIYDKQLVNSADSVTARIKTRQDKVVVDLPPAAQAILRHNYQDEFFYQVLSPDGNRIAGDKILPPPPSLEEATEPVFRTIDIKGKAVRVVTVSVPTPELAFGHVIIQAAETRNTRTGLAGQITISIFLAQLVLIASGALAIWIGVRRGLMPLAVVEKAVAGRAPGDLSPLEVEEPIEILSLITALNRLFKMLQEDIEAQKRFTANAAHQLRTPLAVLGTYCDLSKKLVQEGKNSEAVDILDELESGVRRMSKMVNRLLALARSEPAVASSRSGMTVDLNFSASNVSAAHVPEALKKKIDLAFSPSPEPALISGDPAAIEELISNLIENSVLYTQISGNIEVKISLNAGRAILTISDDGIGIPREERERVFERFYRIPATEPPGTGLGLAIVKEIATAHNAEVTIGIPPNGKGTAVAVSFPELKKQGTGHKVQDYQMNGAVSDSKGVVSPQSQKSISKINAGL